MRPPLASAVRFHLFVLAGPAEQREALALLLADDHKPPGAELFVYTLLPAAYTPLRPKRLSVLPRRSLPPV